MKLLYVANLRLPTEKAYGIQVVKMCESFARAGAQVTLLVPSRNNSKISQDVFDYYGVQRIFQVKKLSTPDFYWPGALDRLAFWLKSMLSGWILARYASHAEADVIYSRDEPPLYILTFLNKSKKIFFEMHNFSDSRKVFYNRFKKLGIGIITISAGLKEVLIKNCFSKEKVIIAHDGVDASRIFDETSLPTNKDADRSKLNLPQDKKIVVYVGSFYERKGIYILADAAKILGDEVLIVALGGNEKELNRMKNYLDSNSITNFKMIGYNVKEAAIYQSVADVLVLPNTSREKVSELYTSPLKLFSYMASRRPIVASDLPSLREVLSENNAILVKPDSPSDLAMGIKKIISNPELANKLSTRAFTDVEEYTWDKRAEKILGFINIS